MRSHAVLAHVPRGEADLSFDPSARSLLVATSLTGLAADSIHPSHIHAGSCAHQGRIAYVLSPVSADANGMASDRTSSVPRVAEGRIPAAGWYIDVHNGPDVATDAEVQPIACGDVANPTGANDVVVPLINGAPGTPDQTAAGVADLSSAGGTASVTVAVHGLAARSPHAADLHAGSCEAQAAQLEQLGTLTADDRGDATATTTLGSGSIPPGPLYVIVHRTSASDSQADFDPVLCGNLGGV